MHSGLYIGLHIFTISFSAITGQGIASLAAPVCYRNGLQQASTGGDAVGGAVWVTGAIIACSTRLATAQLYVPDRKQQPRQPSTEGNAREAAGYLASQEAWLQNMLS